MATIPIITGQGSLPPGVGAPAAPAPAPPADMAAQNAPALPAPPPPSPAAPAPVAAARRPRFPHPRRLPPSRRQSRRKSTRSPSNPIRWGRRCPWVDRRGRSRIRRQRRGLMLPPVRRRPARTRPCRSFRGARAERLQQPHPGEPESRPRRWQWRARRYGGDRGVVGRWLCRADHVAAHGGRSPCLVPGDWARFPNQLGGREAMIRRADLGAKGTFYRAMVGPFASSEQAAELCSGLKAAGGSCIVQRN